MQASLTQRSDLRFEGRSSRCSHGPVGAQSRDPLLIGCTAILSPSGGAAPLRGEKRAVSQISAYTDGSPFLFNSDEMEASAGFDAPAWDAVAMV